MNTVHMPKRDKKNGSLPSVSGKEKILRWLLLVLVVGYPALVILSKSINAIGFYLLLVAGVFFIVSRKKPIGKTFGRFLLDYWPLWLSMSGLFLAECVNQWFVSGLDVQHIRVSLHFLALPLFVYVLLVLDTDDLVKMRWGFVLGAIACAVGLFVLTKIMGPRPPTNHYFSMRLIPFTNLAVLLGFWSVLTLGWIDIKKTWVTLLHIVALGASVFVVVISQTRAAWISIIVLFVVLLFFIFKTSKKLVFYLFVITVAFLVIAQTVSKHFPSRLGEIQTDVTTYSDNSNLDTSIGQRIQIYKTSWLIFTENVFFGIGKNNYQSEMQKKVIQGKISQVAAEQPHAHNQILNWIVRYGISGFIIVIAYGLIPFLYFFRFLRSSDIKLKTVSYMGISMGIGFFLFGLSDVIYEWKSTIFFYIFMLSMLLAFLIRRQSELNLIDSDKQV